MKIIVVNDYGRIVGGAAKIAIMSARAFAERGYEVEFFAGNKGIGPELAGEPRIKVTCLESGPHTRDPNRLRGAIRGLWYRPAARKMREILSGYDPEDTIIHFHAYRETLTTSVADVAIKMGFVCVYTAHEYTMACPYGGLFDFRKQAICPLTGLSAACLKTKCNTSGYYNKLWYFAMGWVFSKICKIPARLSHTVFLSKLSQGVLRKYLPKDARYTIVDNLFDYAGAAPLPKIDQSPFLFVGALEPHKDPVTAAKAAFALGAPITFVGTGALEAEIREAHPEAVITGWVGREEVETKLRSSRALIFPSIWYEAQPCTTMEAAACGLPVIVGDLSAAVELVQSLGVGEIFKAGDVEDLIANMRPYLDTEFAYRQGRATQEAFLKLDMSAEHHVSKLVEIYEAELAHHSSSS